MNNFNNWPSSRCSIVNCGCEESTSAIDLEKVTENIPETPSQDGVCDPVLTFMLKLIF